MFIQLFSLLFLQDYNSWSAAEPMKQSILIALFQILPITLTVFPISEEQPAMLYLAWANPAA